jgi:hypothetical protein
MEVTRDLTGSTPQIADRTQPPDFAPQTIKAVTVEGLVVHFIFEFFSVFPGDATITGLGVRDKFLHCSEYPDIKNLSEKFPECGL